MQVKAALEVLGKLRGSESESKNCLSELVGVVTDLIQKVQNNSKVIQDLGQQIYNNERTIEMFERRAHINYDLDEE